MLASSEAFVSTESAPHPAISPSSRDVGDCYRCDCGVCLCHYELGTGHEASNGEMLPSRKGKVDSGQSEQLWMEKRGSVPMMKSACSDS